MYDLSNFKTKVTSSVNWQTFAKCAFLHNPEISHFLKSEIEIEQILKKELLERAKKNRNLFLFSAQF